MYTTRDRRTAQLPAMVLNFGVLGPLQMTANGEPLALGTPKQRAVLAMLVMSRNRPVSSESLVNAAWEQFPPPEPKASLHTYISNLRRLVAGVGLDAKAGPDQRPPVPLVLGRVVGRQSALNDVPRRFLKRAAMRSSPGSCRRFSKCRPRLAPAVRSDAARCW